MSVGEICNRDVIICRPHDSIQDAAKLMREYHVGDVVVIDDQREGHIPIGILTDRDIVIELLAEEIDMKEVTVNDVMSRELVTVGENEGILTTIEQMREKGVRRVPVVNHRGELEGILAADDMIELFSELLANLVGVFRREIIHEKQTRQS